MPTIWTLLRATAVVVGGSAALVVGGLLGTANADPASPVPAPNIGQQLVNTAANAPQMLQSLAAALGGTPPAPATPPPLATLQMPQLPSAATPGSTSALPGAASLLPGANSLLPGANSLVPGANSLLPGATPATTPAALPGFNPATTGPAQLLPQAQFDLPQVPFLPVPLPQQLSLPGDLASLTPGGVPMPRGIQPSATPVSAPGIASVAPSNPLLIPLSALP
jgi:hypothetical protein